MKFKIKFPSFGKKEVKKEKGLVSSSYSDQLSNIGKKIADKLEEKEINLVGIISTIFTFYIIIFVGSTIFKKISPLIEEVQASGTLGASTTILSFFQPIFWLAILLIPMIWIWRMFRDASEGML